MRKQVAILVMTISAGGSAVFPLPRGARVEVSDPSLLLEFSDGAVRIHAPRGAATVTRTQYGIAAERFEALRLDSVLPQEAYQIERQERSQDAAADWVTAASQQDGRALRAWSSAQRAVAAAASVVPAIAAAAPPVVSEPPPVVSEPPPPPEDVHPRDRRGPPEGKGPPEERGRP